MPHPFTTRGQVSVSAQSNGMYVPGRVLSNIQFGSQESTLTEAQTSMINMNVNGRTNRAELLNSQPIPSQATASQLQRTEQVYPLGTREDVQADDYESPISNMFGRAFARYRVAEEVRQAERIMNPQAADFVARQNVGMHESYQRHHLSFQPLTNPNPNGIVVPPGVYPFNPGFDVPGNFSGMNAYPRPFHHDQLGFPLDGTTFEPSSQVPAGFHGNRGAPLYINPFLRPPEELSEVREITEPVEVADEVEEEDNIHPDFDGKGPNAVDRQHRPTPLTTEQMKMDISCKICKEQKMDTLMEPCMHIAVCHWCADAWARQKLRDQREEASMIRNHCPVCRTQIKNTRRVHLA